MITPFMLVNLIYLALESTAYALAVIVLTVNLTLAPPAKLFGALTNGPQFVVAYACFCWL